MYLQRKLAQCSMWVLTSALLQRGEKDVKNQEGHLIAPIFVAL